MDAVLERLVNDRLLAPYLGAKDIAMFGLCRRLCLSILQQVHTLQVSSSGFATNTISSLVNERFPLLHTLDLMGNNIGDEGARHIAEA